MADTKTQTFAFGNNGIIDKLNPSSMQPGMYRRLVNMESLKEGQLTTRRGSKLLGTMGSNQTNIPLQIRKLVLTSAENRTNPGYDVYGSALTSPGNPRYVGLDDAAIYVTQDYATSYTSVATSIADVSTTAAYNEFVRKRWNGISFSPNATGKQVMFFATPQKMLKTQQGNPLGALKDWGVIQGLGAATAADAGAGNLNGGAVGSQNGSQPYDYVYTYVATDGQEGNPSVPMSDSSDVTNGKPIAVYNRQVTVTVIGATLSSVGTSQIAKIAIYRRGGILYDAYRFVGYVTNPGLGATATFTDNIADVDLGNSGARQLDYFNEVPVQSAVAVPLTSTTSGGITAGSVTGLTAASNIFAGVTDGTLLHFNDSSPEVVAIVQVTGLNTATVYCQQNHNTGAAIEIDSISGQACHLVMQYGERVILAGDPNNQNTMYMSRAGYPESFPLIDAAGAALTTIVGTPSNGIVNMTEFRGSILSMNRNSFFNVYVQNGSFIGAIELSAKGLGSPYAWCNTGDEIWYFTKDGGIWSWDGGTSKKRSEQIDLLFKNIPVDGMPPVDMSPTGIMYIMMEYTDSGQIRFMYKDVNGNFHNLVSEPMYGDRWRLEDRTTSGVFLPTTVLFQEKDLGILIMGRKDAGSGPTFNLINSVETPLPVPSTTDIYYTSDEYTRPGNNPRASGGYFAYEFMLPWIDLGSPNSMKLIEQAWLEVDPNYPNSVGPWYEPISIEILVDYQDTPIETITIDKPPGAIALQGRLLFSLLPQSFTQDGKVQSFGREVRAVSWRIYSNAYAYPQTFYTMTLQYQDTGLLTAGGVTDWQNLGSKFDKKLYQLTIEFDPRGLQRTVYMDTVSGKGGAHYLESVQSFLLDPSDTVITGNGRALKTMPINDGVIVKEVRIRQASTNSDTANPQHANTDFFTIYGVDFVKEEYPEDVVAFTPYEDGGYAYSKYANQVTLEVNTNGKDILVQVQADGATVETITVNSTERDRRRNITLNGLLAGYQWRLFVDVTQANIATDVGMFQLWRRGPIFRFQPADRGEVGHSYDWDQLGSPNDKLIENVVFEWDNTGGATPVTLQCDMIKGLGGQTVVSNVLPQEGTIVLDGGRGKKEYSFFPDVFCKLIKFYPVGVVPQTWKNWKYEVKFTADPPDRVPYTLLSDQGYPYGKTARNVIVTADTGGIPATFDLEADGAVMQTFAITTTYDDRRRIIACNPNLSGKLWRIVSHPGTNGLFKLFDFQLDYVKEPPSITQWSSYGQAFGYKGFKVLKQGWLDYSSTGPVTLTITSKQTLGVFTITLPAHATRGVERWLFTSAWPPGLNKGTEYDILISAGTQTFQLWGDASGLEWIPCGADRHSGYQQFLLSEGNQTLV